METKDLNEYVRKKIKIQTKQGGLFSGMFIEMTNFIIVVEDIKVGKTKINISDIASIYEIRW